MNILFYNTTPISPEQGGTERVTDLVSHYLKLSGYTIYYLIRYKKDTFSDNTDIKTYFLPNSTKCDSQENVLYMNQLLKELEIDVLINQDAWYGELYLCNHKILNTNVKIISSIHYSIDSSMKYYNELFGYDYSWSKPFLSFKMLVKHIFLPLYKKRDFIHRGLNLNFMHRYTDAIVVLSPKYVEEIKELLGVSYSKKIKPIPNPLTFSNVKVRSMEQKENVILFVGRLSYSDKRVDRLLQAWHKIQDKLSDWRVELVGDGADRARLENLAMKLELKNVFFCGYQSPLEYYSKAKIISLVSTSEGFSMSIVEGMQNGCIPIVFSSYSAVTDIIKDGINGCLVAPFDIDLYAEKLYKLASDSSLLNRMQPFAVQSVEQVNIDKIGHKWIELFQSL